MYRTAIVDVLRQSFRYYPAHAFAICSSVEPLIWVRHCKAKSNHARSVQYRARKQAADSSVGRLLTRAVLFRRANVAWPDLETGHRSVSFEGPPEPSAINYLIERLALLFALAYGANRIAEGEDG